MINVDGNSNRYILQINSVTIMVETSGTGVRILTYNTNQLCESRRKKNRCFVVHAPILSVSVHVDTETNASL